MSVRLRKNSRNSRDAKSTWLTPAYFVILLFALVYVLADMRWQLARWVAAGYLLLSLICLVLFVWDKVAAQAGRRRISENKLLFWSLLGGWPGAIVAQAVMRHKINKTAFCVRFWFATALNIVVFIAFATPVFALRKALFF